MMKRPGRLIFCLIAATGLLAGSSSAVLSQQTTINKKNSMANQPRKQKVQFIASKWGVNCPPQAGNTKLTCILSQSIVVAKSRKVFLSVSVRKTPAKILPEAYMAVVRLPHGLNLGKGVQYQIDDQALRNLPLFTSSAKGVFARTGLSDKAVMLLQKGKKLTIKFSARGGRKISVPMSLQGFAAGFEKVK